MIHVDKHAIRQAKVDGIISEVISDSNQPYFSISLLKRKLHARGFKCSPKFISRILKRKGLRWLPIKPLPVPQPRVIKTKEKERLHYLTNYLAQAAIDESITMIFQDEIFLGLDQSPLMVWRKGKRFYRPTVRMNSKLMLYCCVATKYTKIVALQVFTKPMTAQDFSGFLVSTYAALKRSDPGLRHAVFMDNASFHTGLCMKNHPLEGIIIYNLPGLYMLNYIENIFSMFRYFFRSRPVVDTREQELQEIVKIAFRCNRLIPKSRYFYNHIRAVRDMLKKHLARDSRLAEEVVLSQN